MLSNRLIAAGLAAGLLISLPAHAARPDYLDHAIHAHQSYENYISRAMDPLRQLLAGEPALTPAVAEANSLREEQKRSARRRGAALQEMAIIDRDGDTRINGEEAASSFEGQWLQTDAAERRREHVAQLMKRDSNGDGFVTIDEIMAAAAESESQRQGRAQKAQPSLTELLAFAEPGQPLTPRRLYDAAKARFAEADTDGSGVISPAEATAHMNKSWACPLPPLAADARLILYGAYQGAAIPSVTVVGQDKAMTAATIRIEPGKEPLYIMLMSHNSFIWRIEGETSRVASLVVAETSAQHHGIVGLPSERVIFLGEACKAFSGYFQKASDPQRSVAISALQKQLGRAPDNVGADYSIRTLALPSGLSIESMPAAAPVGFDEKAWSSVLTFFPRGVDTVDPAVVVSSVPAMTYQVLPSQAGIAQLVASGSLTPIDVWPGGSRYRINPGMSRFPAGLDGAYSVTFILPKGIARPAGDPGHSQIIEGDIP